MGREGGREGGPPATAHPTPHPPVPGVQEDEEREESGCEEEEGREDEDEDSGSEESLVDSDSDPEEKGACSRAGNPEAELPSTGTQRNCSGQWMSDIQAGIAETY